MNSKGMDAIPVDVRLGNICANVAYLLQSVVIFIREAINNKKSRFYGHFPYAPR